MKVLFENEGHRFSLLNDLKVESQYGTTPINGDLLSFQKREYLAKTETPIFKKCFVDMIIKYSNRQEFIGNLAKEFTEVKI